MCENNQRKPHVHADVIKAWADGAVIEYKLRPNETWRLTTAPRWDVNRKYRIKPEPTDLEKYGVEVGDVWLVEEANVFSNVLVTYVDTLVRYIVMNNGKQFILTLEDSLLTGGHLVFRRGVVNKL